MRNRPGGGARGAGPGRDFIRHDGVSRYYDPGTGQFLSVDPMVQQTRQAYLYAADNPVSMSDPTGDSSEGYCAWVNHSLLAVSGWASACMIEINGNAEVGFTLTAGGGGQLDTATLSKAINNSPESVFRDISVSAGIAYEVSNANRMGQLGSWFANTGSSICVAHLCGLYNYFLSLDGSIHGHVYGFGLGTSNGIDLDFTRGYDYTWEKLLQGNAANYIAGLITNLNIINPLHWLAGPLNLYTN